MPTTLDDVKIPFTASFFCIVKKTAMGQKCKNSRRHRSLLIWPNFSERLKIIDRLYIGEKIFGERGTLSFSVHKAPVPDWWQYPHVVRLILLGILMTSKRDDSNHWHIPRSHAVCRLKWIKLISYPRIVGHASDIKPLFLHAIIHGIFYIIFICSS